MKLGKETLLWTAVSVIGLISVISLFLGVNSPDDIHQNAQSATSFSAIVTHWNNFRYFIVVISQPFLKFGVHYNEFMPLWVLSLVAGIAVTCFATLKYSRLPLSYLPFFIAIITVHGYFTNIFYYPMSYSVFGFGFLFTGLAVLCLAKKGWLWTVPAAALVGLALMSYQPAALIILHAAALSYLARWLNDSEEFSDIFQDVIRAPIAFVGGVVIFLLTVKAFSDGTGRAVDPGNFFQNVPPYLHTLKEMLFGLTAPNNIYPHIQRVAVLIIFVVGIVTVVRNLPRHSVYSGFVAIAAFGCAFLIFPSPLNLFSDLFWPSPRSISASVFFIVGLLFILINWYREYLKSQWLLAVFVIFISVSAVHQIRVMSGAMAQNLVDEFAAKQILSDIGNFATVTPQTKIAVKSTWKNGVTINPYISNDNGLSAFSANWSNNNILWLNSQVKYTRVLPPEHSCEENPSPPLWRIEKIDDTIVVCMR
ncbi:hypothetical protein F9K96_07160 [Brucella anthropi]|uniref:glucosyltransferase domain-containing protein n=1 Tax=Brucella anthropi TaxID=529 RepID=UPI0004A766FE|nr:MULTISPECIES: glucosyltransferase domain-containing protein [Brucella/Ochrobactrum group]KAB2792895.1 hypothetical protein F9K96_07160 [Brucella anthropi]